MRLKTARSGRPLHARGLPGCFHFRGALPFAISSIVRPLSTLNARSLENQPSARASSSFSLMSNQFSRF